MPASVHASCVAELDQVRAARVELEELAGDELLQSGFWGAFRSRFGWLPLAVSVTGAGVTGTLLLLCRRTPAGTFVYCPLGPQAEAPSEESGACLDRVACAVHPLLPTASLAVRFDPPWPEDRWSGAWRAAPAVQPLSTVIVDLRRPEADLLAAMKPKTRYNVRLAERRGVVVREAGAAGLDNWYRMHRDMARRQGITRHSLHYFRELFAAAATYPGRRPRLLLLIAEYAGEEVAGIVVSLFGRRARYLYGASADRHRHAMPNYSLQWAAMRLAKEAGCDTYDLFGIPRSADPTLPMAGLYRMKTGFGGVIVHRAPAFDAVLNRPRHAAFRAAEKTRAWYLQRGRTPSPGV